MPKDLGPEEPGQASLWRLCRSRVTMATPPAHLYGGLTWDLEPVSRMFIHKHFHAASQSRIEEAPIPLC